MSIIIPYRRRIFYLEPLLSSPTYVTISICEAKLTRSLGYRRRLFTM